VVAKLFHIVEPDAAFFGQKDAAQVAIIRRMVRDLDFAVEVVACPIVREADGLAMSSRNAYLDGAGRKQALVLHRALLRVEEVWKSGEHEAGKLLEAGREEIAKESAVRLDYFEVVDAGSLEPVESAGSGTLVGVAAWVGSTRLIDNLILESKGANHKGH
jgi:pantoate--beta-alanine ligase